MWIILLRTFCQFYVFMPVHLQLPFPLLHSNQCYISHKETNMEGKKNNNAQLLSPALYNSIKSETAIFQRYCPFFLQANTRWDSLVHTVTQAFRHSLAHTHTISVTFHYMVLGWISGLEIYQISTQGAPPPHPRHCLSTTMLNCCPFAVFKSQILIYCSMWIDVQAVCSHGRENKPIEFTLARWKQSDTHSFMVWIFLLTLGFVSEQAAV